MSKPWLTLVGIGEDGREGLSRTARAALDGANLVVGGRRHLALAGPLACETMIWPSPIENAMPKICERRGKPVVVLATGDPFHYGIGAMLSQNFLPAEIMSIPQLSAFSLAASRLCWSLQDVACVSLHGRDEAGLIRHLSPGQKILVLSWDGDTPKRVAQTLCERGLGASRLVVLEAMGGARECTRETTASAFDLSGIDPLNTVAIHCAGDGDASLSRACLPDDAFEHDGQITKQGIRAVTLAALAPRGGECLWDIGAGSGSIAIEWQRADRRNKVLAIESKPERSERIARNAGKHGVTVEVVTGKAPEALAGLPVPDAVFVGGGVSDPAVMDHAMAVLRAGGRLVANAVTLEAQAYLARLHGEHGGALTLLQHADATPVGTFRGWKQAMPIVQWRWGKPS